MLNSFTSSWKVKLLLADMELKEAELLVLSSASSLGFYYRMIQAEQDVASGRDSGEFKHPQPPRSVSCHIRPVFPFLTTSLTSQIKGDQALL